MKYDKAYLISLEQSGKRRRKFYHRAVKATLDVQWIPAVYGLHADIEAYQKKGYLTEDIHIRRAGSLGTLLSHLQVWDIIANDPDCERGLIFEDDAIIPADMMKKIQAIPEESLPGDWDMLWLGWHKKDIIPVNKFWGRPRKGAKSRNSGHFAYIIRSSSIDKLKAILLPYDNRFAKDMILRRNFSRFAAYFLRKKIVRTPLIEFDSVRKKINDPKTNPLLNNFIGRQINKIIK